MKEGHTAPPFLMLLTLCVYEIHPENLYPQSSEFPQTFITSYPIRMTNRRFGLTKKSPTTHFRKLAARVLREAFNALQHVEFVRIGMLWEGRNEPYCLRTYGPVVPEWNREDYYTHLSWLSRDIAGACQMAHAQRFEQSRTSKPYRFRRKGALHFVNYGGKGYLSVIPKHREVHYDYHDLSAKTFSRTLAARYMARYIDWDHKVRILQVSDKDGLRRALENLEMDVRLGGGKLYISHITRTLLGMEQPAEEPLPF